MTKDKKAKEAEPFASSIKRLRDEGVFPLVGLEAERRAWLGWLELLSRNVKPEVGEKLRELRDILEWDWFPPRSGNRPKTKWQMNDLTLKTWALICEVAAEEDAMKERGEVDPRRCAEEAVAARHNITRREPNRRCQKVSRN